MYTESNPNFVSYSPIKNVCLKQQNILTKKSEWKIDV